jgi:cell wall-associated NlpC family hydrolase
MTHHNHDILINRVLAAAQNAIGVPYVPQAANLTAGCDCLGFVYAVLQYAGLETLPPLTQLRQYSPTAPPIWPWQQTNIFTAGDVLLFAWLGGHHLAIAHRNSTMVHACMKRGVCREEVNFSWQTRLRGVWRPTLSPLIE